MVHRLFYDLVRAFDEELAKARGMTVRAYREDMATPKPPSTPFVTPGSTTYSPRELPKDSLKMTDIHSSTAAHYS
jgi:hypothetical protein